MSEALRVRVTPAERKALEQLAGQLGKPMSHLLRRAIREMVTGGPDFFDDGLAGLSEAVRQMGRLERRLASGAIPAQSDISELKALLASTRAGFALQVRRSRNRWVAVVRSGRQP